MSANCSGVGYRNAAAFFTDMKQIPRKKNSAKHIRNKYLFFIGIHLLEKVKISYYEINNTLHNMPSPYVKLLSGTLNLRCYIHLVKHQMLIPFCLTKLSADIPAAIHNADNVHCVFGFIRQVKHKVIIHRKKT